MISNLPSVFNQKRAEKIVYLQNQVFSKLEQKEPTKFVNEEVASVAVINNQQVAEKYISDLGLLDLHKIADNQEKAWHLYGFYDFLRRQKIDQNHLHNLVKSFQLAVYYDDNYVYRYYLSLFYTLIGEYESAVFHLKNCLVKIKNQQTNLYPKLEEKISLYEMKKAVNDLFNQLREIKEDV